MKESDAIKAKGVKEIVCVAVNDPFVMAAWGKAQGTEDKVRLFSIILRSLMRQEVLGNNLNFCSTYYVITFSLFKSIYDYRADSYVG